LSRILVVDDDASIVAVVSEILVAEGHEVVSAENGAEALRKVDGEALVLLDMRMPVMDGWGFARAFRSAGKRSPIVVMTAAENARRWAEEIGADGYLAKPFEIDALIAAVERHATGAG
jgi:CheY-like chemotaxis protein